MPKSESSKAKSITPYPLAMVICDFIWKDPYTGKMTIIGTFSAVGGASYPLLHPILSVYASLTDGVGTMPVSLRMIDVNEANAPLFDLRQDVNFPDPRAMIELGFAIENILFPAPGEYRLQLFANDEFIIERRILAVKPPHRGGKSQ